MLGQCEYSGGFVPPCYYFFSLHISSQTWVENTKPQNISYLRQNKVLKCARCNNLQCLPVIPNYWNVLCFSPATYMPSCYRMMSAPHQPGWCRVQCQLSLAELCSHCFLFASDSVGTQCLGWSPTGFHMWFLRIGLGFADRP